MSGALRVLARLYGAGWELRRRAYARGWAMPRRVPGARVVSIGNLTVGGTGKTTLTLHLAREALRRRVAAIVVCRRYRARPGKPGDEEALYAGALGEARVRAGRSKLELARQAAAAGARLILVDDGFSHWRLERDLDVVLLDSRDLWGGARLLPEGRLREPRRALARAAVVVVSRLGPGEDPARHFEAVRPYAPAALLCAGRHRVTGVTGATEEGADPRRVLVVTGTGNPAAVEASAREAGLEVAGTVAFRDHHPFTTREAGALEARARAQRARLLLTAKDAVRWPAAGGRPAVLEVAWEWVAGGAAAEERVFAGTAP